jgi:hypothetical protein
MPNAFVESVIRRHAVRCGLISLAGALLVLIALALNVRYFYNMAFGPFTQERAALTELTADTIPWQYYVTVAGDKHADTGFQYVSTTDSGKETVENYYHVLVLGDRLLLVKSTTEEISNEVTGALEAIPSETQTKVVSEMEKESPKLKGHFLAVMLDDANFYTGGFVGLGVAAVIGLICMIGIGLSIWRWLDPSQHPAMKALARFGDAETVIREIDADYAAPHEQLGKDIHFTSRWFISTIGALDAAPYRDILWCHKQVTQHRTNGIPTHKTYAAYIFDRYGKRLTIGGKDEFVNQVLQGVAKCVPGVAVGYSVELEKLYRTNRAQFATAVDTRRQGKSA